VPNALQRRIEARSIAVVVLADREQPLEVVAGPIQAERGQQSRGAAIAVHERMDVHQLELGNAADQHRMHVRGRVQLGCDQA